MRFLAIALTTLTVGACAGDDSSSTDSTSTSGVDLTGAGATFPYPIYSKWASDYEAATGVKINYQSKGSGAGIKQLSDGTVDFGASDGPMTDEEMAGPGMARSSIFRPWRRGCGEPEPPELASSARWRVDRRHLHGENHEVE
jgi:TRAP-type uncharacterized transport system substrate-binding protein